MNAHRDRLARTRRWITALVLLLLATFAHADGKVFQRAIVAESPTTPDQRALVVFDEARGVETLVVETTAALGADAASREIAWVIPLPARPEIETSTTGLFPTLDVLCAPEVREDAEPTWVVLLALGMGLCAAVRWSGRGLRRDVALALPLVTTLAAGSVLCAGFTSCSSQLRAVGPTSAAEVLDRQTVGVFDTTTLTATDAPALRRWLTENGFAAPESIDPVVTDLLAEGWVFVASKARLAGAADVAILHPLAFTFPTREAVYPMRLTGVDAEPLDVALFVCGTQRAATDGLEVTHCSEDALLFPADPLGEVVRRTSGATVMTKLVGTLDVAAMQRDVAIRWEPFVFEQTVWFTTAAVAHHAFGNGVVAAIAALLLAVLIGRRVDACASGRPTRFDAWSLAAALAVGGVACGITFVGLPRVPDGAVIAHPMHGDVRARLSDPPDAIAGNAAAVRAWATAATLGAENSLTGAAVVEEDSPGNWWLREDGDRLAIVIWDQMHSVETIDVSRLDELTGSVTAADGSPVSGAEIRFSATNPERPPRSGQNFGYDVAVRTSADGSFVARLRAGRTWDVAVAPEAHPYALREGVEATGPPLDLVLPRTTTLRGRVLDAADRPAAGVTVAASVESPFRIRDERFVTTDADGWFEIRGLDAETDDLWVDVHVHEEPNCRARITRRFRGRLPPAEPFVLRSEAAQQER